MKVVLFSNDVMPFGNLPTSGGGLRCWQIYQGLKCHGIDVVASMPGFTYLINKHKSDVPQEQRELLWFWDTQEKILNEQKPDAVIYASNWDHYALSKKPDVPLIIDLHGSRLIETTMWGHPIDKNRKLEILSLADCLLTAGTWQRNYFYGWLTQAGRVPKEEHFIKYIPISLSPDKFKRDDIKVTSDQFPHFVSGGGWFPWQNQSKAIFSICKEVSKREKGQVDIFGTPHDNAQTPTKEEVEIRKVYEAIKDLSSQTKRIKVNGYVGREDLLKIYSKASVAVEAMSYNLERELAFTTRTIEYLWCGLPVIYNNYNEVGKNISEYDAGWTINPESQDDINQVIDEIYSDPQIVQRKSINARKLVEDRFSWDKTILPLVEFIKKPQILKKSFPATGHICTLPSYLNPKGIRIKAILPQKFSQVFTLPAEDISSIEVNLNLSEATQEKLTIKLFKLNGKKICNTTLDLSLFEIGDNLVKINLPTFSQIKGGERLRLDFELSSSNLNNNISIYGLSQAKFPIEILDFQLFSKTELDTNAIEMQCISMAFVPGGSKLLKVKNISKKALKMAANGDFKRIYFATRRRVPMIKEKILKLI